MYVILSIETIKQSTLELKRETQLSLVVKSKENLVKSKDEV